MFDVEAIETLRKWLENTSTPADEIKVYIHTAKVCMKQNFFQFRKKFYQQINGVSMGNPLSPMIAEIFMASFETSLETKNLLPRFWTRYVDDVLAIVKKNSTNAMLHTINNQFQSIKFTIELEINKSIPFLDLLLTRKNNKIDFAIHHKQTSTKRTITNDSHCAFQHKMAAFHSSVHRLCKIPLSIKNYKKEYEYIKEVATINGYKPTDIDVLINKHSKNIRRENLSTLFRQNETKSNLKHLKMTFAPTITNHLKIPFKKHNLKPVFSSNHRLKDILGSTKDKTPATELSGIYQYNCDQCPKVYIGQTKRNVSVRFNEHLNHTRLNQPTKSAIAHHAITENHRPVLPSNIKIIKQVNNPIYLDAFESFYIQQNKKNCINNDDGNINSNLFSIIKQH